MSVIRAAHRNDDPRTKVCRILAAMLNTSIPVSDRSKLITDLSGLWCGMEPEKLFEFFDLKGEITTDADGVRTVRIVVPDEFLPDTHLGKNYSASDADRSVMFIINNRV